MWNHCRGQLIYHTIGTVKIPQCRNSKNIPHCRGALKYHTLGTVRTFPTVWYFNCPRQCGIFLLFRECGNLTGPGHLKYHTVGTVKIPHCQDIKNIPFCQEQLIYHTAGTDRQCGIFLLFQQCGILTVHDNV
jgi:hypothetical protein